MTSSISSSSAPASGVAGVEHRVPVLPSGRMTVVLLATALVLAALWEGLLAARGIEPNPQPAEMQHWLQTYDRAMHDPADVMLIGSSRVQVGMSPVEFARVFTVDQSRVANLGAPYSSSLPVLRELADNERFQGYAVVEVLPVHWFGGARSRVEPWLQQAARPRMYLNAELISHSLYRRNARSAAGHGPTQEIALWFAGPTVSGSHDGLTGTLHGSRWFEVDDSGLSQAARAMLAEQEVQQFRLSGQNPTPAQLQALIAETRDLVSRIESRGGAVLLVRMPSDRQVRQVEDARFPDDRYWKLLAAELPGHCLHFADDPILRNLDTYDGSHLGAANASVFSRRLAEILKARGR